MRQELKMLDLMVSVVGTGRNNNCNGIIDVKEYVQDDRQYEIHSDTSVSSDVFTVDEDGSLLADDVGIDDEDSVSCSATADDSFRIDILCQKGESEENSHRSSVSLITRQFLPISGYMKSQKELGSRLTPPSPLAIPNFFRAYWLNLKVMESDPMFQNVQPVRPQKARKSRRGPPSRSSPYRGVTDCGKQLYFDVGAACCNLDLNLWLSTTKEGTKRNHVQNADIGSGKRPTAGGLAVTSMGRQLSVRPSMNSSHTPNNEEMTKGTGSAVLQVFIFLKELQTLHGKCKW
ncbi:hypothetical protein E3N88_03193 [Mikania micrantha]|uniref:Uncharacterized protein n=1 Tax=Mikania micrantha TaxID=192012 RepID=A0A5N6Q8F6_9ASTR|nr:hypothetical protein E3N88_03193 [Mikania micrantha]